MNRTLRHSTEALRTYRRMRRRGTPPNRRTFPSLLKECAEAVNSGAGVFSGETVHGQALKQGMDSDVFVQNSLIHLYASCGRIEKAGGIFWAMSTRDVVTWTTLVSCYASSGMVDCARQLFDEMPDRTVVSYSAMISGYVQSNRFSQALLLFADMEETGIEANDPVIVSTLCACAASGSLEMGKRVHRHLCRTQPKRVGLDTRINTSLINMYFKCGSPERGARLFHSLRFKRVGEWTAFISGLSAHGFAKEAALAFEAMVGSGVRPNPVTFSALLTGCAHAGLVDQGLRYCAEMRTVHGLEPSPRHLGCLVDLLARAGLVDQALQVARQMRPCSNSAAAVWGSVLSSSREHGSVEAGEEAAERLIGDDPENGGLYMTLLGMYRRTGREDGARKVKREMKEACCRKKPGCSWVEVDGARFEFVAGDRLAPAVECVFLNLSRCVLEFEKDCNEFIYFENCFSSDYFTPQLGG